MCFSILIELYAKKSDFIVCNVYLNKYDYEEINKDTKIPA